MDDDDPLLHLAKEAFAKYDINGSGTIDQKVHTVISIQIQATMMIFPYFRLMRFSAVLTATNPR